jgi:hypothetical protein
LNYMCDGTEAAGSVAHCSRTNTAEGSPENWYWKRLPYFFSNAIVSSPRLRGGQATSFGASDFFLGERPLSGERQISVTHRIFSH